MPGAGGAIDLGLFRFDPAERILIGENGQAQLSPLGARLISILAAQPGRVVSRDELIAELWNDNHYVGDRALNRLVSETRRAARDTGSTRLIETVQKSGYRLTVAWQEQDAARQREGPPFPTRWIIALVAFALAVGCLAWLMDTLTGLVWLSQHPN